MNAIEKTRLALIRTGQNIVNLSSGNMNEFGIYCDKKIIQQGVQQFLQEPCYKPDPKGNLKARQALEKYYQKKGLNLTAEDFLLTSGSSESYFHLFTLLAGNSGTILFPRPSYPLFEEIARMAKIQLAFYDVMETKGWQINLKDIQRKMTKKVKAIVIVSPGNPTGAVQTKETLQHLIHSALQYNIPLISDEVFSEYIFTKIPFPRLACLNQRLLIFTINGISKTYALPGLKLSWIAVTGSTSLRRKMYLEELERSTDVFLSTNHYAQTLLPFLLEHGDDFIQSFHEYLEKNRNAAFNILKKCEYLSFHETEGGFYIFVRINIPVNRLQQIRMQQKKQSGAAIGKSSAQYLYGDEQFVIGLMKKMGIFVHPGYFYDYEKGLYILISLLPPLHILEKSLKKILEYIYSLIK